jgi:4-phosphopantoate--beta-alanine ligase
MGKTVIVIDLNPLSRSAQEGTITIVDELSRALTNMVGLLKKNEKVVVDSKYNNEATLKAALEWMLNSLKRV